MSKLNVGVVCYPSYGGSGVVATELGLALAKRGHSIHFISYETPFRLYGFDQHIQFHEVDMQSYPLFKYPLYTLALTSKIIEVCEANRLDVLHVHYAIPHSICAFLSRQMLTGQDVKIVTTLHGTDITLVGQEKAYSRLVRFGIIESDRVTAVSQHLKDTTIREFSIDREIDYIPNFVDPVKFSPTEKKPKSLFVSDGEKMVIHVSNFRPVKNIETIIRSFQVIVKGVKSRLVLIGDGPDVARARELAKELDICDNITFLGRVEHLEDVLPSADLILLPSLQESFGLVLLEAMSCGVPTISSNVGGIPELVDHGKSGYIYDPHDHEAMAKKAIEVLSEPKLQAELGNHGRHLAETVFNIDKVTDQYEKLYYDSLS